MSSPIPNALETIPDNYIEVSVRGKWIKVPALRANGNMVAISGKWLKIAAVHDEEWMESEIGDPEVYLRELVNRASPGFHADIFTFTQKVPVTIPKFKYAMVKESIAAAHIPTFKEWWDNLPQESRKNVRRSQKRGVVVRVKEYDDDLVRGIVEVNNESRIRQGRAFPHYGKTFEQVRRDHSAFLDRSDFICAYYGDEFIGFLKLVYRGEIASILQLLPKAAHSDKRPANAMLAKAVELCEAKGISYITYSLFNYGNKGESSLRQFKTRNGFREILMPRYYIPLTSKGKLCMKLRLHRGLYGVLPKEMIRLLIGARDLWYSFKHGQAGVAQ